jgi:hypothetical protein
MGVMRMVTIRSYGEINERLKEVFKRNNEESIRTRRIILACLVDIAGREISRSSAQGRVHKILDVIKKEDRLGIGVNIFRDDVERWICSQGQIEKCPRYGDLSSRNVI